VQAYIIQPRIKQQSTACWTRKELEQFVRDIDAKIQEVNNPGITLCAGEWCKYCKYKPKCKEHARQFTEIIQTSNKELDDPIELAKRLELGSIAKKWYDSVRHAAQGYVAKGGEIPGYYMQTRQGKMRVEDPNAAYQTMVADGCLTHEQFMEHVTITPGKLEDAYSRQNRVETGETLKEGKEFFQSQPWVTRGGDSQVLTKSRKKKDN
jgi:hypothetical protein